MAWSKVILLVIGTLVSHDYNGFPLMGAMPGYGMDQEMFGVNLAKPLVADTLNAISRVAELSVSVTNLPNRSTDESLPDPFCVTYLRPLNAFEDSAWIKFHGSEVVMSNLNPEFTQKPLIPPSLGDGYSIMFKLFDSDPTKLMTQQVSLGYVTFNLKELLSYYDNTISTELRITKRSSMRDMASETSKVTVRVEYLVDDNDEIRMEMRRSAITKKKFNSFKKYLLAPFVEISKQTKMSSGFSVVHRTEMNERENWDEFTVPLKGLINGNENRTLKFTYYDWNEKGREWNGDLQLTFAQLREKFIRGDNEIVPGHVRMAKFERISHPTFTEFIKRGLKFHLNIVIDFSDSNGSIQSQKSLHACSQDGSMNEYQRALNSVVTILEDYDLNKSFPVFGFAAQNSSDAFQLNPTAPECAGVDGVLEAYLKFIKNTPDATLARPLFAPVLRKIVQGIKNLPRYQDDYYIILIFTAGKIDDISDTETVIKEESTLPISIIIVGVGDATGGNFADMQKLDGDHLQKRQKTITGVTASRDIVRFVPFNRYVNSDSLALAKELLAEIPDQVMAYMNMHNFKPGEAEAPQ